MNVGTDDAPDLMEAVEALEEEGKWFDAIDAIATANRATPKNSLVLALAQLRHRAAKAALAAGPPRGTPAEPGTCPPLGESGLPEADAASISPEQVRAALLGHGSLLLRRVLSSEHVATLTHLIDTAIRAQEAWPGAESVTEPSPDWHQLSLSTPEAMLLGRKWIAAGGGVLLGDSPRASAYLLDLYAELGLRDLATGYLGERPMLSVNKNTLRRVSLAAVGGWHQDGAFLGDDLNAINLWLPLTPCGVDAPGLDIIPKRFEHIVETGTGGAYFDWAVGSEVIADVAEDVGVLRPRFDAGDLLIFDDMCLHRTAIESTMTTERYAIESWSFAPSSYPDGQVPLLW